MEKIELRIAPAADRHHGHLFIIYRNKFGEEFIVRGGPGALSIWDDIDVEIGHYTPASRDWKAPGQRSGDDNVLLAQGPDLETEFLKMAFFAQLVEQARIDYDTVSAVWNDDSDLIVNSNSLVAAALASVGIIITEKDLPPTAKRLPPAGFKNTSAFQRHFTAFFAKNYGFDAAQGDRKFREIYDHLETVYLDRYRGKLSEISNFTNGHGTPEYPKIILEGIDWRATENHIRERFSDDPKLAASILVDLATARTLKGDWETEFLQTYGDYVVFENSPAGQNVTRGSLTNVTAAAYPDQQMKETGGQPDGEAPLSGAAQIPGSAPILPPTLEPSPGLAPPGSPSGPEPVPEAAKDPGDLSAAGSGFVKKTLVSGVPAGRTAAEGAPGVDPYARKTSYDRNRKVGRTPEEEEEAKADFEELLREAYVVTNNIHMARGVAAAQMKLDWGSSVFAAEENTVMKYPVEKAYVDPEKDGHGYVRSDVERLLTSAGVKARRWYLEPNAKTGGDRFRGTMDEDGYGPRMTLSYDDEAGNRHVLTEGFQAHVKAARERRRAAEEREQRELARLYGIEWPEPPKVDPFEVLKEGLARQASLPELRAMALEKRESTAGPKRERAAADAPKPPPGPLPDDLPSLVR